MRGRIGRGTTREKLKDHYIGLGWCLGFATWHSKGLSVSGLLRIQLMGFTGLKTRLHEHLYLVLYWKSGSPE